MVALTFDDGPDPELTPRILAMLDRYGVRATFNVMGYNAMRHSDLLRAVVAGGHELGNHTWTHQDLAFQSTTSIRRQLDCGRAAIQRAAGVRPRFFRPPRGELTGAAIRAAAELDHDILLWSVTRGPAGVGTPRAVAAGAVAFAVIGSEQRDSPDEIPPLGPVPVPQSAFAGFRFPPTVIVVAVRWYLRFGLSYRDVEELLAERGVEVDHVTVYRWVQRFTPLLADATRPCRHAVGDRWWVDETYVKVAGRWRYVYRAIDHAGQIIDVFVSPRRDAKAAHRFFERAIGAAKVAPVEVTTDKAPVYPAVLEELLPAAWHRTEQYGNNRVECDHGRLKARLRPTRGLKQDRNAAVMIAGHAFVQNVRRGHTNWPLRNRRPGGWPSRSTSCPWSSDAARTTQASACAWAGAMRQRPST